MKNEKEDFRIKKMDILRPLKEVMGELKETFPDQCQKEIIIHGIGTCHDVMCKRGTYLGGVDGFHWGFKLHLNEEIILETYFFALFNETIFIEEGDKIEFFGTVSSDTRDRSRGRLGYYPVKGIQIYQCHLSDEEPSSEVLMFSPQILRRECESDLAFVGDGGDVYKTIAVEINPELMIQQGGALHGELGKVWCLSFGKKIVAMRVNEVLDI